VSKLFEFELYSAEYWR